MAFYTKKIVTVSNSLVEDGLFSGGSLRVINSSVINSQLQLENFESQNSTITSCSILNYQSTVINASELIDSHHEWNGQKGILSNTAVRNTSIIIGFGKMTFSNSQLYPTKVFDSSAPR